MKRTVFYSWQSDLPNATNRGFIQHALEQAASSIAGDDSIDVEPVVDRDTTGVAGSPDIAGTILSKIDAADVFVPDISLVTPKGIVRRCPNPNVSLELGFAIKALEWPRIIMVMNTAFGAASELPFDLRGRRVLQYELPKDVESKAEPRKLLKAQLGVALRTVFENQKGTIIALPTPAERAIRSIESVAPDRAAAIRRLTKHTEEALARIEPDLSGGSPEFQRLKDALDASIPVLTDFGRVASRAAEMKEAESLPELYRGLEPIAARYKFQGGGSYYEHQCDFWRFIGHELVVMLVACMIREGSWELLGRVLDRNLILEHTNTDRRNLDFSYLWQPVVLCNQESQRRGRVSYRCDLLTERHSSAPLATVVEFTAFMAADYLLFLRAELPPEHPNEWPRWIPESAIFMTQPPRYLLEAQGVELAQHLAAAIGVDRPETLRERLRDRHSSFLRYLPIRASLINPFADIDTINKIGSR